ncbi:MAG TPA: NAD(P)H-hydrate dehydratase, partial [Solimonas sp.]|nr:NAD(P)H-hydrate dehydratase [Solimonas sp.]
TWPAHALALTAAQPELMCHGVETWAALNPLIERASVIVVGPGLGQDEWGRALLARVLECEQPLVLDADALNLLAEDPSKSTRWVLTPHPGEAARLLEWSTAQVQHDRVTAVRALRERYGGVAVLKGAGTLVLGESLALCPHGNPGMAVGGMGDVLAGILGALLAQGLPREAAARAAVLAHAIAGDHAACVGERGLLPGDLLDELRAVVNP